MSFGSHNLESEPEAVTTAQRTARMPSCPLSAWGAWLGWLVPWRRPTGPRRRWAVATAWGAKWAAALWVVACVKCIVLYIVIPSVIVWWGGSSVAGGGADAGLEKQREREPQPSVLVESVSVSDELLEPVEAGR